MKRIATLLLSLSLLLAACPGAPRATATPAPPTAVAPLKTPAPTPRPPTDMASTLATSGNLTMLGIALETTGLAAQLKGAGPFTLFAPTDQAFAQLEQTTLDDPKHFTEILLHHVVAARVLTESLTTSTTVTTLLGDSLSLHKNGKAFTIEDAQIALPAIHATNGLIYVVDKVLLPPLKSATLANASKPATIGDLLASDPRFATLVTALRATGVYTELQGAGPITFFAPTQQAFSTLPTPLVNSLFKGTGVWTRVLHYHIVPGKKLTAAGITSKQVEQTAEGSTLVITQKGNTILVGDAKIIQTDIQAANGVIHVIDQVLVPPLD
ncbi:MAG: fasciclin domain-containing protein [Caldilineaceae bacterium]